MDAKKGNGHTRVRGEVTYWTGVYGFAQTKRHGSVFIHVSALAGTEAADLVQKHQTIKGISLKFNIGNNGMGEQAIDVIDG